MQTTTIYKSLGLAFGALLLTACASKGDIEEGSSQIEEAQEETTQVVDDAKVSGEDLKAQAEDALRDQTVFYFDFDQSTIKADGKKALKAHAKYLAANSSAKLTLEGHADERGTIEYNLALGERRSMSVRSFLLSNGAKAEQLKVVSFGEERPAVMGHTEEAYAKNRRVEVKY